ncbi:hypothetical protein OJ253_3261 [Cryptosporidium canis]|uniref:poly(ADP-ribose) glycohydrolase n=1 Tax=Cryptosporidium canis TaxID=195482 RepID=A0A9D5HWB5_9CRYT|nr:hypothetical protein OJ253_3261 [Cryptosporidium canis]
MNRIRYIFNESGLWSSITTFITGNHHTVNSVFKLKSFVRDLGKATGNEEILESTHKISTMLESSFSNADKAQSNKFFSGTFSTLSLQLAKLTDHLGENALPVDIILQRTNAVQIFTRKFIVLVMFAAFLGLFPKKIFNDQTPGLGFDGFFGTSRVSGQQLSCFLSYFNIMADKISSNEHLINDRVIFERHHRVSSPVSFFTSSKSSLQGTKIIRGYMETYNHGGPLVEAIFANKVVGSSTLLNSMHQEEILMSVAPETLIARIFHTNLHSEDALTFRGLMKYSWYTGFGSTFAYVPIKEEQMHSSLIRVYASVDAFPQQSSLRQFTEEYSLRELNKLVPVLCVDFYGEFEEGKRGPFVTGYWGGGVFGGDVIYKFLIQLIAACVCNREMVFSDTQNKLDYKKVLSIEQKYKTCGNLAEAFFRTQRQGRFFNGNAIDEILR